MIRKPEINDIFIRVRLKTDIYGIPKFSSVKEVVEEANNICQQIKRHCNGIYDVQVCSDADGVTKTLGEWNKSEWM